MDKRNFLPDEKKNEKKKIEANVVKNKMKNSKNGWKICSNKAYTDVVSIKAWVDERTKTDIFFTLFVCNRENKKCLKSCFLFWFLPQMEIIIAIFCWVLFALWLYHNECLEILLTRIKCVLFWFFIVTVKHLSFAIEFQHLLSFDLISFSKEKKHQSHKCSQCRHHNVNQCNGEKKIPFNFHVNCVN